MGSKELKLNIDNIYNKLELLNTLVEDNTKFLFILDQKNSSFNPSLYNIYINIYVKKKKQDPITILNTTFPVIIKNVDLKLAYDYIEDQVLLIMFNMLIDGNIKEYLKK